MIKRIDTVFLPVKDFKKAISWYVDVLGLTVRWTSPDETYCAINIGETPLTLVKDEGLNQNKKPSHCLFNFYTPDIKTFYEHLKTQGVTVFEFFDMKDIQFFEFLDCEGNRLGACYFQE